MVLRSKMTAAPSNRIFGVVARFVRTDFTQLHFNIRRAFFQQDSREKEYICVQCAETVKMFIFDEKLSERTHFIDKMRAL
jgi:hypothetical protein